MRLYFNNTICFLVGLDFGRSMCEEGLQNRKVVRKKRGEMKDNRMLPCSLYDRRKEGGLHWGAFSMVFFFHLCFQTACFKFTFCILLLFLFSFIFRQVIENRVEMSGLKEISVQVFSPIPVLLFGAREFYKLTKWQAMVFIQRDSVEKTNYFLHANKIWKGRMVVTWRWDVYYSL